MMKPNKIILISHHFTMVGIMVANKKNKPSIKEGWRTFLANDTAPISTDFYNTLVENVVRIYLACGESDKAVTFWNEYAESDQTFM